MHLMINTNIKYNESRFAAEMAAEKKGGVALAENGVLYFKYIVYPAALDMLPICKDNRISDMDRCITDLKSSVMFFVKVLQTMTGGEITAIPDNNSYSDKAIVLKHDTSLADKTHGQGFELRIQEKQITIASDDYQGISNGIYSFLEDSLGCMFATSDFDYIPHLQTIHLPRICKTEVPDFQWRNIYSFEVDGSKNKSCSSNGLSWNTKLRLNAISSDWYNWCHTSFSYISPKEYFDTHPEYFSLYHDKRRYKQGPVDGQLCWTNEEVYRIISKKVFREMAENPDKHIWDISQMDNWINRGSGCQCSRCRAIDRAEGSQMGSLLTFINRLADECHEKFPDNYISTLAYNHTAVPPRTIRPRNNVIIKLCLMPGDCACSYAHPTGKNAEKAHNIVKQWGKIAQHIVIWDYLVNFHNYLMPHPPLYGIAENHKFYLKNHTYGIFHQMAYETHSADAEMSAYLISKSMWNKDTDISSLASKYLKVTYGDASPYLAEYYNTMYSDVLASKKQMYIYDAPSACAAKYFSRKCVTHYLNLIEKALKAVEDDAVLTRRVQRIKLNVLYLRAAAFSLHWHERLKALNEWKALCDSQGIVTVKEGETGKISDFYHKMKRKISVIPYVLSAVALLMGLIIFLL